MEKVPGKFGSPWKYFKAEAEARTYNTIKSIKTHPSSKKMKTDKT